MNKSFFSLFCISALLISGVFFNKTRALDLSNLIGLWNIYDSNNALIDTIDITLAVTQKNITRFSYQQESHNDSELTSQQGIMVDNLIIFDLIKLGYTKTYVGKINESTTGAGGIEISNQLASCSVIGNDTSQVARKFARRLASGSARCDGSVFFNYSQRNIKLAKNGTSPSNITTGGNPSQDLTNNLEYTETKLSGIWDITIPGQKNLRLINKNIETNFLGYQFIYRLVNPSRPLLQLNQSDFLTGSRLALLVDNYLILNPTGFDKENQLLVLKTQLKNSTASGKDYRTYNGDCVPLKNPINSVKVCTPSDQSTVKPIDTKQYGSVGAARLNTKVSINF
jgi:hypothetical protein